MERINLIKKEKQNEDRRQELSSWLNQNITSP